MSNPFVKDFNLVYPKKRWDGSITVVVLDRAADVPEPDYQVVGNVGCYVCDAKCWLGPATYELVRSGEAAGVCLPCAERNHEHWTYSGRSHVVD